MSEKLNQTPKNEDNENICNPSPLRELWEEFTDISKS